MGNLGKLLIALGLAVAAFVLNLIILNSGEKPMEYAVAAGNIKAGTEIKESDIASVAIPGNVSGLQKTFIPFTGNGKGQILGIDATRDYLEGDLFLLRDLPKEAAPLDVLGPFRLLSVGEALINKSENSTDRPGRDNTVTIAMKAKKDGTGRYAFEEVAARRLLQIVDSARNRRSSGTASSVRIVNVVLMRKANDEQPNRGATPAQGRNPGFNDGSQNASDNLGLKQDEIAVIVPLENIEILPGLLMRGNEIGFVTPAYR